MKAGATIVVSAALVWALCLQSASAFAPSPPSLRLQRWRNVPAPLEAKRGFGEPGSSGGVSGGEDAKKKKKSKGTSTQGGGASPPRGGFVVPDGPTEMPAAASMREEDEPSTITRRVAAVAPKPDNLSPEEAKKDRREMLRSMGVQSAYDEKTPTAIPGVVPQEGKEVTVTMFDVIPMEIQGGIENVLKALIAVCFLIFLVDGIAIAWEAFAVSTQSELPGNAKSVIDDVLFPLFTPSLVTLLSCSSVLGLFKLGQFQKGGVEYKED